MIKVAGKPSSDPIQEKLRQSKKIWNKQVSEFADDLFRIKDTMNGKPSKFHPEKSSIKDPIPGDPVTIIGVLVSDFQDIAQKGNDIIRQQLEYSKTRKRKQPKQSLAPMPTSPNNSPSTIDLSKQLTATADMYQLIALGSNPLTRFFARLLNPSFGTSHKARTRKYRMSLLKSAVEIFKDLVDLEAFIVKSSPESIFNASKLLSKIEGNWNFFKTGLNTYKETMTQDIVNTTPIEDKLNVRTVPNDNITITEPSNSYSSSQINSIIEDYKKYSNNFTDINLKNLFSLIGKFLSVPIENKNKKSLISSELQSEYNKVLSILNIKYNTNGSSFKEVWETKQAKAQFHTDQLEAVADRSIERWLGKIKHQLGPSNKTSAYRLDIYKAANKARDLIDKIMDSLEKEMNTSQLEGLANQITAEFKIMERLIRELESTLRGKNFDKSFMDLLESGKITNFDPELTSEQRGNLQKMIERRRVRELTDFYQNRK